MLQSNEYFSGKVKSIGFTSSSTGRASVGVMAEGEYTFGTAAPEEMTVVSGALNVLLPGETEWKVYAAGDVFNVPCGRRRGRLKKQLSSEHYALLRCRMKTQFLAHYSPCRLPPPVRRA